MTPEQVEYITESYAAESARAVSVSASRGHTTLGRRLRNFCEALSLMEYPPPWVTMRLQRAEQDVTLHWLAFSLWMYSGGLLENVGKSTDVLGSFGSGPHGPWGNWLNRREVIAVICREAGLL